MTPATKELVRLFCSSVDRLTEENMRAAAPHNVYKERYRELLETMRATGELDDYTDNFYVDMETGLLCAAFRLRLPVTYR